MLQHHSTLIKTLEAVDTTSDKPIIVAKEDEVRKVEGNGEVDEVARTTVI